ncbi:MAG: CocE/NonD family hydrolase [Candidatus Helarchaeota archaeon]|nr:CocE/NonD family hydrolase [Candidatus Helarchaeota archaeon]
MEKNKKLAFDKTKVEYNLSPTKLMSSKLVKSAMSKVFHLINYAQGPFFKILRMLGYVRDLLGVGQVEDEVVRLKEVLMPLKDGAKLATDVYLPKRIFREKSKGPTLLVRLPYWKDSLSILGYFLSSFGYVTVLQDIRGCAHSRNHGTNSFTFYETSDGVETLQWISKRFWYNGRLGMWGGSYFGLTQLALSEENRGLLTCLCPIECSMSNFLQHPGGLTQLGEAAALFPLYHLVTSYEFEFDAGIFGLNEITEKMIHNPLANLYNEPLEGREKPVSWAALAKLKTPQERIDLINTKLGLKWNVNEKDAGEFPKFLKELFYYRHIDINYDFYTHVFGYKYRPTVPILQTGGLFDLFMDENIRDLKNLLKNAPDYCRTQYKFVIGPWTHGGIPMSASAGISLNKIVNVFRNFFPFWWFDFWLKGPEKKDLMSPMIRIYVLNKNIWRHFNMWPPKTREMRLYLHSEGYANSRVGDGELSTEQPQTEPSDEYEFNPANPVETKGGRNLVISAGELNQSKLETRSDILIYTSEKLKEDLEIIGDIKIILYAASSAKDTDFMVKLVDVFPHGTKALNLLDNGIRARYREGDLKKPALLEPNVVYRYEIDLGTTAVYFPKNHRIRIEITSSNYPKYDINSNLAGERNAQGFIVAQQKVFHDAQYSSHLILPVFERA